LTSIVLSKLENLENKSLKETNSIPRFKHIPQNKTERSNTIKETWGSKLQMILIITILISIPILTVIGAIQVIKWVMN